MFEEMTYEYILERALSKVSTDVDKRQGSVIYDALAPACAEIAQAYIAIDRVLEEAFADTASRDYLIMRARERGIVPYKATYAVMKGVFDCEVPIGSRFYLNGLTYCTTKKLSDFIYELTCESAGSMGSRYMGDIAPIDNINGLGSAGIVEVIKAGEDEEDTEEFRKRYFDSFNSLAFGGNKKDYIEKTVSIDGVGGCKVLPVWNGGGTVKLIIIGADFLKPSDFLVESVKEIIDPTEKSGLGEGLAPIGHSVTVEPVSDVLIELELEINMADGYSVDMLRDSIMEEVRDYFSFLRKGWADCDYIDIIAMQVGSRVLNIGGVNDVTTVIFNDKGSFVNMSLEYNEIPVISDIFVNGVLL